MWTGQPSSYVTKVSPRLHCMESRSSAPRIVLRNRDGNFAPIRPDPPRPMRVFPARRGDGAVTGCKNCPNTRGGAGRSRILFDPPRPDSSIFTKLPLSRVFIYKPLFLSCLSLSSSLFFSAFLSYRPPLPHTAPFLTLVSFP